MTGARKSDSPGRIYQIGGAAFKQGNPGAPAVAASLRPATRGRVVQKVQGFGGFFFRAKDPKGLANWYRDHLGINPAPTDMQMEPWVTESGVTVFSPFGADTDYFAADKTFMLNFRVADLDAMVAQLKSADIEISHESEMEGIGRFARIHDPRGTRSSFGNPHPELTIGSRGSP